MGRREWLAARVACAAAAGLACFGNAAAVEKTQTYGIVIEGLKYAPETLVVKRGDTVTWVNKDPFPHTATAVGAFDSGPMQAGKSWRFVARRAGTYAYVCTLHSNMKATLRVE